MFLGGMAAYAAALVLCNLLIARVGDNQALRILIALVPMLPAAFCCGVSIYCIRSLDELQRKLQFEAIALAFAGTALITFSYGFLEGVGFPKLSMFAVWPLMGTLWFIGVMIGRLRFG
ncbi:MAG: hypothetical protein AAGK79_02940 [Pseudomonadota bacterium]